MRVFPLAGVPVVLLPWCEGGLLRLKDRTSLLEMNCKITIKPIHLYLISIVLTLSLRITCTSVEGHWGELGHLTHRPYGPTNPEQPSFRQPF